MRYAVWLSIYLWAQAWSVQAQTAAFPITLKGNERAIVSYRDGRFSTLAVEVYPEGPDVAPAPRDAKVETFGQRPGTTEIVDQTLTFTFWANLDDGGRLRINNGMTKPVIYSAMVICATGREVATTICSVPSARTGWETWAGPVTALRIMSVYDAPNGPIVCGYPERGQLSPAPQ